MPKIIKFLTYFLSLVLTFIFIIVLVTENTNIVSNLYKEKIVKYIEDESQLKFDFDSLDIKWNGLNPNLIFNNISLYRSGDEVLYLGGNKLIIDINTLESLFIFNLKLSSLNLFKSEISLTYNNNGLFLRDHNLLGTTKTSGNYGFNDLGNIKLRISDSNINIQNQESNVQYNFQNINLVLFSDNKHIKLYTTFNHNNNTEIIHLASEFSLDNDNKINGKLYSQALNVNPNEVLLFSNKFKIVSSDLNYSLWADINNSSLSNLHGSLKIKEAALINLLTNNRISLKNLDTNIEYLSSKNKNNILFTNLNLSVDNSIYSNNIIHASFNGMSLDAVVLDRVYVKEIKKVINFLPTIGNKTINSISRNIYNGELSDIILLNIDNNKNLKYSMNFNNIEFINNNLSMNNINGNLSGSSKSGRLSIHGQDIMASVNQYDQFKLATLKGSIFYKVANGNVSLSSEELKLGDSHLANLYGTFSSQYSNYKINIKGDIGSLMNIIPIKYSKLIKDNNISINSLYTLDYRIFGEKDKTNTFGAIDLKNLVINDKQNDIALSTNKLRVNFSDKYIQSYKTQSIINNNTFDLILDTNISGNKIKYNIHSKGIITSDFVQKILAVKLSKSFAGSSPVDFRITYQPYDNMVFVNLRSNMKGMAFNIIPPLNKNIGESKDLEVSYVFNDSAKKYVKIDFDVYRLKISNQKDFLSISVNSPDIVGLINIPDYITSDNRLLVRLNYFNLNKFSGGSDPLSYPFLDLSVEKAKISNYYFNNLYIVTSPSNDGMIIERLDFKNHNLSMKGNGKWINKSGKQITFFDAAFQSNNFGDSLNYLGYSNIIKEGNLSSKLIGQWQGSPELFSFNNFDGKVIIDLKDGEFLQVTKQTRAIGQLLGLFSISSLQKRLSLDFSDFFSSGLSFDTMTGEFNFSKSKARAKDLFLKGSFGEMRVNGVSDIQKRSHNQKLIYIPDLSSMSLISGTLLGGPIGALASIFYDKVLKEMDINTNQLAAVEYSIKGPWDDPEIKVTEPFKPVEN